MVYIMDIAVVILRMLMPIYTVVIVYQCYASMMRHRRNERPLVLIQDLETGIKTPVLFWENSIGRSRASDIAVDDPAVSRDHCVLMRRKEGWFITDVGSKSGTYVNGRKIRGRVQVKINDVISIGNSEFVFKRGEEFHEELQTDKFFSRVSKKPAIKPYKLMILISLFHIFMGVEATFCQGAEDIFPLYLSTLWVAVEWFFFGVSAFLLRRVSFEIESFCLFLSGVGIMLLARQSVRSAYVQLAAAIIGMVLFCIIIKFIEDPDRTNKIRVWVMIGAVGLLALNLIIGKSTFGSTNWIQIGPITIQPSEFVKVAFIFVGASTLDLLQTKKNLWEFIIFSALCVGALALMNDFGTALIFFGTFLLIAFMRSGDFKTIIFAVAGAAFAGVLVLSMKSHVLQRFATWGHIWEGENPFSGGYQQVQTLIDIASGGLFGVGIGNGCLKYIGASETDLVFGILAEEMGFIVAVTIVFAIAMFVVYARSVTTRSRSTFYSISACCAAGLLVIQMSLNVFGATDILPLTGVTLPFISSGGSSMVACWGLLAFIKAADERTYARKEKIKRI